MQPLRPTGAVLLSHETLTRHAGQRGTLAGLGLHCATHAATAARKPSGKHARRQSSAYMPGSPLVRAGRAGHRRSSEFARRHALRCRSARAACSQTSRDVFCVRSEREGHGGPGTRCASIASWRSIPTGHSRVTHATTGACAMRADGDVIGPFRGGGRCSGADSTEHPQIGAMRCSCSA